MSLITGHSMDSGMKEMSWGLLPDRGECWGQGYESKREQELDYVAKEKRERWSML